MRKDERMQGSSPTEERIHALSSLPPPYSPTSTPHLCSNRCPELEDLHPWIQVWLYGAGDPLKGHLLEAAIYVPVVNRCPELVSEPFRKFRDPRIVLFCAGEAKSLKQQLNLETQVHVAACTSFPAPRNLIHFINERVVIAFSEPVSPTGRHPLSVPGHCEGEVSLAEGIEVVSAGDS